MRRATWATLGLLGLSGCETVESSGTPFQPVAAPSAAGSLASAALGETEMEEPKFRMSSDGTTTRVVSGPADLVAQQKAKDAAAAEGAADAAKSSEPSALDGLASAALAAPAEPRVTSSPSPTGSALPPPMMTAPPVADPTQVGGWSVRLVKTIPDAQPPRAVLGLPNGKEIVVTPGTMVPEEGLVVVAVGPNRVWLSQVKPQGDHASITSFTLDAMY